MELTATPFVEASPKPIPLKNVVMDYPLARAMADGYVKEPAVVTQRGFDPSRHTAAEIEKIKLEDGIRLHEATKVELVTYARQEGAKLVKPSRPACGQPPGRVEPTGGRFRWRSG